MLRFSCQDTQNNVKCPANGLEKMYKCMCVQLCMYVCYDLGKFQLLYISGIVQPVELKFGVHLKQTQPSL